MFFVPDDYSAMAALHALDDCGVKIPEDVGFVAWGARGSFPFYRKSVTRIETDPVAGGRQFAKHVINALSGKPVPLGAAIGSSYVRGMTF